MIGCVRMVMVILAAVATGWPAPRPRRAARGRAPDRLFARQPPPADLGARRARVGWRLGEWRLGKGEPLGFRASGGEVIAVAGRDETRLSPGRYCWHTKPGSEPVDWVKTALLAGTVALVIGLGVYLVASYEYTITFGGPLR